MRDSGILSFQGYPPGPQPFRSWIPVRNPDWG
jgi:hypothetical protein